MADERDQLSIAYTCWQN